MGRSSNNVSKIMFWNVIFWAEGVKNEARLH